MREIKAEVVKGEKVIVEKIKNEYGSVFSEEDRRVLIDRILHPKNVGSKYDWGPEHGSYAAEVLNLKSMFKNVYIHCETRRSFNLTDGSLCDLLMIFSPVAWNTSGLHAVECARINMESFIPRTCMSDGGMLDTRALPRGEDHGATVQGQFISLRHLRSTFPTIISNADVASTSYSMKRDALRQLNIYCRENHPTLNLKYMEAIGLYVDNTLKGFYIPEINFMWLMDITHYREGVAALGTLFTKIEAIIGHPIVRVSRSEESKEDVKLTEDEVRAKIGEPDLSKVDITLGCDQEFELMNDSGSVVLPNPEMFHNAMRDTIGLDGSNNVVEFRPAPGKTHRRLLNNVQKIMEKAKNMKLSTDGNHLPVGCHIHFGVGMKYYPHDDMLYLLDRFLTIPCYPINGTARGPESEACRYGRLSDYRPQPHGFEYRSLPASVMSDNRFFKIILQISRNIVQQWMNKKDFEFSYKASEYDCLPYEAYDKCCHISLVDYEYFVNFIKNYKCELKNVVALWVDTSAAVAMVEGPARGVSREDRLEDAEWAAPEPRAELSRTDGSGAIDSASLAYSAWANSIQSANQQSSYLYVDSTSFGRIRAGQSAPDIPIQSVPPISPAARPSSRPAARATAQRRPGVPSSPDIERARDLGRSGRGSLVTTTASLKNAYRNIELFMTYAGGDAQQWASEVRKHIRTTVFGKLSEIVDREKNVRVYLNIELSGLVKEGGLNRFSVTVPTANVGDLSGVYSYRSLENMKIKLLPCDPASLVIIQTDRLPLRLIVGVPEAFLCHSCDTKYIVAISDFIRDIVCMYVTNILKKG
jgi:hypothetical protein